MDDLHRAGGRVQARAFPAHGVRGAVHEHGADALAAIENGISHGLVQSLLDAGRRRQPLVEGTVDPISVVVQACLRFTL